MVRGRPQDRGPAVIFVSYAREDAQLVAVLVAALRARGLPCLLDPPLAQGDVFWRDKVARWLTECQLMLMVDSPSAGASPWVCQERRACTAPQVRVESARLRHDGCDDAVLLVQTVYRGPHGATPVQPEFPGPESAARAARRELAEQALTAFLAALPAASKAERAGDRAWLAGGRVEMRRVSDDASQAHVALEPVTNALYRAFLDATDFAPPPPTWERPAFAADDLPVTGITWYEAAACAAWCGGELPSESIWALATADGSPGPRYATADGTLAPGLAHYGGDFATGAPRPAAAFAPTANGFRGLCGNTWDWCATSWGAHRVIRGGGWMDSADFCTVDARYRNAPIDADCCVGLRIAWRAADATAPPRRPP